MTQDEFNEAVLNITGNPDWALIKKGLENDVYHAQAQAFNAPDWGGVRELKGFAQGLTYVMNLRETVIQSMETAKANAALDELDADI